MGSLSDRSSRMKLFISKELAVKTPTTINKNVMIKTFFLPRKTIKNHRLKYFSQKLLLPDCNNFLGGLTKSNTLGNKVNAKK